MSIQLLINVYRRVTLMYVSYKYYIHDDGLKCDVNNREIAI